MRDGCVGCVCGRGAERDAYDYHVLCIQAKLEGAAIGIDLGTTNSCVAVWMPEGMTDL